MFKIKLHIIINSLNYSQWISLQRSQQMLFLRDDRNKGIQAYVLEKGAATLCFHQIISWWILNRFACNFEHNKCYFCTMVKRSGSNLGLHAYLYLSCLLSCITTLILYPANMKTVI